MALTKAEKKRMYEEAYKELKEVLKAGMSVYTVIKKVSSSGMTRHISVLIAGKDNSIRNISWHCARLLDWKYGDDGAVVVSGCGMDMGFHLIYCVSSVLFRNGFECLGIQNCPSNDHINGDRNFEPHLHKSGGYALIQRWI